MFAIINENKTSGKIFLIEVTCYKICMLGLMSDSINILPGFEHIWKIMFCSIYYE